MLDEYMGGGGANTWEYLLQAILFALPVKVVLHSILRVIQVSYSSCQGMIPSHKKVLILSVGNQNISRLVTSRLLTSSIMCNVLNQLIRN